LNLVRLDILDILRAQKPMLIANAVLICYSMSTDYGNWIMMLRQSIRDRPRAIIWFQSKLKVAEGAKVTFG